jgi:hypothetical protein
MIGTKEWPIFLAVFCAFLGALGQLLFKLGSSSIEFNFSSWLTNIKILGGVALYGLSAISFKHYCGKMVKINGMRYLYSDPVAERFTYREPILSMPVNKISFWKRVVKGVKKVFGLFNRILG